MKIKVILYDVGGIFIHNGDTSKRHSWEKRLHLALGKLTDQVYLIEPADKATVGLVSDEDIWRDIEKKFSLTDSETHRLKADFYASDMLNIDFYNYAIGLKQYYQTAILSNAWINARTIYKERFHLDKIADLMVISAEVGMKKPDAKIFTYTLDLLKVVPEEVLFLDDTLENVVAANALGINAMLFTDTNTAIEKMKTYL